MVVFFFVLVGKLCCNWGWCFDNGCFVNWQIGNGGKQGEYDVGVLYLVEVVEVGNCQVV